jgi:uncharacterized protein YcfL
MARISAFQADHAGSIPVTRSKRGDQVFMRRLTSSFFLALVLLAGCSTESAVPVNPMGNVMYTVSLEPGQKTTGFVATHCGYERLAVTINGRFWMTDSLGADSAGNPTEPDWPYGTQKAELQLELLDSETLRVKAVGSEVTHTYHPVETEAWCE